MRTAEALARRKRTVATMDRRILTAVLAMAITAGASAAWSQLEFPIPSAQSTPNPLLDTTTKPGKMLLYDLEAKLAKDVLERGGEGFAAWFAEDGVALGNGVAPLIGKVAIAKSATWSPKAYRLTWTPTDALMGPSSDMGYTWGHFEGHSKDANGNDVTITGRYMTIWRRQADGSWKVVLDAGANEPPEAADCCKLPGH